MNTGDIAGDCQAKAGRLGVLIAGVIEPVEGPKYLIALILRDARPVDAPSVAAPSGDVIPASAPAEVRQLQFATPGGTRIIWVFNPDFSL